jgi:hypothetical protein
MGIGTQREPSGAAFFMAVFISAPWLTLTVLFITGHIR